MNANKRLLLIVNPCAGQKRANRYLPELIRMCNERGYECVTYVTGGVGDAAEYLRQHAGDAFERIVCIGGDGTLNETMSGLCENGARCPVGYIPAGSTNDYAYSLGLSNDIPEAMFHALTGRIFQFDLGKFNERTFIYTASCGAFTRASYSTPQAFKNVLGHMAYILEGVGELANIKPIGMRIETDDGVIEDEFILCCVTNSVSVAGILKLDANRVCLNDGLFEVLLVHKLIGPAQWSRVILSLKKSDVPNDLVEFFKTSALKITTESDIEWTLDGERGDCGREFTIRNLRQQMRLILPGDTDLQASVSTSEEREA